MVYNNILGKTETYQYYSNLLFITKGWFPRHTTKIHRQVGKCKLFSGTNRAAIVFQYICAFINTVILISIWCGIVCIAEKFLGSKCLSFMKDIDKIRQFKNEKICYAAPPSASILCMYLTYAEPSHKYWHADSSEDVNI